MTAALFSILIATRRWIPPWLLMWLLTAGLFAAFKGLSWVRFERRAELSTPRALGFLLGWVGFDPSPFLSTLPPTIGAPRVAPRAWARVAARTCMGAALVWGLARHTSDERLTAWTGSIGLVLLLHFGVFEILTLVWRQAGVAVKPIMRSPLRASSVSNFWSSRWNLAFREMAHRHLFRPLLRFGAPAAHFGVFFVSGLLHEVVISVPAGGGYGLPLGYFVLQGAGSWFERSDLAALCGLRRPGLRRAHALLMVAAPVYWLFHPPFMQRVMLPFLSAIGAT